MPPRSTTQLPARLYAIAARQDGMVSRRQLGACGFDRHALARRVDGGRWQFVGPAVALHSGDVTARQQQWAAILAAPGRAALTGRTACQIHGLRGFDAHIIDVVVPASDAPVRVPGVRWHRSRRFDEFDVDQRREPPVVRRDRAIIDAAVLTPSVRVACGLMAAAVQQRLTSAPNLRRELLAAGAIRHRRQLLAVAGDIEGGADSLSEIDFTKLARKAGLPPPIRQAIRLDREGRRRYLDADFETFQAEVDGGVHLQAMNYWADARRQNDLVLGGDRILRFPSIAIRLDEDVVVAQLKMAGSVWGVARH